MNTEIEILIERAKKIAGRKDTENKNSEEIKNIVEFLLIPERYAFESKYVSEVLTLKEITSIPGTPAFVMGVINLRGRIISVINLKVLFNIKEKGLTELNKVIILKNESMEFGIIVDAILANKVLDSNTLKQPPLTLDSFGIECVEGVSNEGLILLNADNLLKSKQIVISK